MSKGGTNLQNLLSFAKGFEAFQARLSAFFADFSVLFAVEILLFFLLFYYVSKILRDNDATKLMIFYWILLVVGGLMLYFTDTLIDEQFYLFYTVLMSAFMLILFSVEVKKSLWDVHTSKKDGAEKSMFGGSSDVSSQQDVDRCISNIIKALQNMSKNNVGALVVLSRGSLPKQVLQSGVSIEAEISTQLIEGIFFPKSPLHDGALIVHGHKIQAAGCFLPLTQKTSYPKEYGTRHRAAIGITEVANVISLVVSEETGIISIVKQGNVIRYADYDMLTDALHDYYWQEMLLTDKKRK